MDSIYRFALSILERIEASGYEAFLVGGCVRDRLLGVQPKDYDITTNAHPMIISSLFPKTSDQAKDFGTIRVVSHEGCVEVTTYRREGSYIGARHPAAVHFIQDIKEDLSRRDFTINAIAQDRFGRIIDPFNGSTDLQKGVIRTVGNATERFEEDALRMIRAIRFKGQFNFLLDSKTEAAILGTKKRLRLLAIERVMQEMEKILLLPYPAPVISLLWKLNLIADLPPFYDLTMDNPTEQQLDIFQTLVSPGDRWLYFFFLLGLEPKRLAYFIPRLRLPKKKRKQFIHLYQRAFAWPTVWSEEAAKKEILRWSWEELSSIIRVSQAIKSPGENSIPMSKWEGWREEMPLTKLSDLAISGNYLLEFIPKGPWIGKTLMYLYHQVALKKIPNEVGPLLRAGRVFYKQSFRKEDKCVDKKI